mgnify:CR=1 FL=1
MRSVRQATSLRNWTIQNRKQDEQGCLCVAQTGSKAAGKAIFGFSFGTVFIILIVWSILLKKQQKNTGWKNHEKTQKRTAVGGLSAGIGNVRGAALQLPASRKSRQLYGSDAGHRGGQR